MTHTPPLRGLAQVTLFANDVSRARDWYADLLGHSAYFQRPDEDQPAYVEFRLGDHGDELGIVHRDYQPPHAAEVPGGAVVRWHVEDVRAIVGRLLDLGAREYESVIEREAGFVTASVIDPFGNVLGLIHSPHWLEQSEPGQLPE